ncbi:hypothetical protein OPV22_003854 [Ensete ventricosum]|uniref:Cyclin-dependent kinase inhibitor n=1 Tax=Ensete ventricosum TaxID=4639 RepID=A0AAV8S1S6_ENSVE|nr:hypothetical protein OPV22_003854 [Ensete ventricosum]
MGKYMRKPKFSGELTVMEGATHQPSLGVCTRARATAAAAAARDSSLSYLELRSRRLEKPPSPASKPRDPAKVTPKSNPSSKLCSQKAGRVPTSNSGSLGSARMRSGSENDEDAPPDVEVSFGENVLEPESRERETTPCSLTRDSETIGTPGSTTSSTYSTAAKWIMQNRICQGIPTSHEMEEFFVGLEKLQQQIFIEKYNFDPVNDRPLPGRYEWEELDS